MTYILQILGVCRCFVDNLFINIIYGLGLVGLNWTEEYIVPCVIWIHDANNVIQQVLEATLVQPTWKRLLKIILENCNLFFLSWLFLKTSKMSIFNYVSINLFKFINNEFFFHYYFFFKNFIVKTNSCLSFSLIPNC